MNEYFIIYVPPQSSACGVATNNLDLKRDRDVVHKLRRSIAENTNSPSNHEEERKRRRSKLAVALFCCRKKAKLVN